MTKSEKSRVMKEAARLRRAGKSNRQAMKEAWEKVEGSGEGSERRHEARRPKAHVVKLNIVGTEILNMHNTHRPKAHVTKVRGHYIHRGGKLIWIPAHKTHVRAHHKSPKHRRIVG